MKLKELAERLGCELSGDPDLDIHGIAAIDEAGPNELTFLTNPKYSRKLATTRAGAVLLSSSAPAVPLPSLRCDDPYQVLAGALALFYEPPPRLPGVHPTAIVGDGAKLGDGVSVGPYVVIGERAEIGDGSVLHPHVVVYPDVKIGKNFVAHAGAVIRERVVIGDNVVLHAGVVLGSDGFGFVPVAGSHPLKIPQTGSVKVEDDVEIGANSTVDRATVGATVLGAGAKLDNLVMIGHGSKVGEDSLLAGQVGLAGSTVVGRRVLMGGQAGAAGHLTIGDGAQVAAKSGISNSVEPGAVVGGYPAIEASLWRRAVAAFPKLPDLLRRVRQLELGGAKKQSVEG